MAYLEANSDWQVLYREALFESNSEMIAMRIDIAGRAIRSRMCELSHLDVTGLRERSQLDSASYFLGPLRKQLIA